MLGEINFTEVVLESIRSFILLGIILFLWREGRQRRELSTRGWNFIFYGFLLLLFGTLLDISDEFEALNRFVIVGDTQIQAFLEKMIGYLGGFLLLAMGLQQWIPTVRKMQDSEAALRQSHTELRHLTGRLISAHEEERRKVARELHDDLVQRLAALAIEAGRLEAADPGIAGIREQISRLADDVQGISHQLHPAILTDLGLSDAIASDCARILERDQVRVEFTPGRLPAELSRELSICLYRVFQESMRNIAKHSGARIVQISLDFEASRVSLVIHDDGSGFDPSGLRGRGGLGLASMEERVRMVNGRLTIQSRPGEGTTIRVEAPLSR